MPIPSRTYESERACLDDIARSAPNKHAMVLGSNLSFIEWTPPVLNLLGFRVSVGDIQSEYATKLLKLPEATGNLELSRLKKKILASNASIASNQTGDGLAHVLLME